MGVVTVGVLRNNLWSLRFAENVHVLFSSLDSIQWELLESECAAFATTTAFHIGSLQLEKCPEHHWKLTFPGVYITSNNKWIVCDDGIPQEVSLCCNQMQDLLEYAIHMRKYGQLCDE